MALGVLDKLGFRGTQDSHVSLVNEEYSRRLQERRWFELQWRLNIAFVEGNQYLDINPVALDLQEVPKLYWWQERESYNQIAPIVETRIARISRLKPILKARPSNNDQANIRAAKIGSAQLKDVYYEQGIFKLMTEVYAWMETCGTAFFKNTWNPNKGPVVAVIQVEDEKTGELRNVELREGDLETLVCSPHEIMPDSSYRDNIDQCRSILHIKAYHVDEIDELWNIKVKPEETVVMQLQRSMMGTGGLGYGLQGGIHFSPVKMKDYALVKELWIRPTKEYPEGRLIIVASGKLLHEGPMPYKIGKDDKVSFPFVKVDSIERPGCFWGKSVVERLIPVQRRYNAIKNRKAEYLNRVTIGGWWIEEGSVDMDLVEAEINAPGTLVEVAKGSQVPKPIEYSNLPPNFDIEETNCLQEFNALSGVSDLSKLSKAPPGVKSGIALNIAQEQDDTRLISTVHNIEQFLIENGRHWLRMYRHYVPGIRTVRVIGQDNVVELIDWTGADITTDDVLVESFSSMAESPAQRRQMVFDLLGTGILNDPDTGRLTKEIRAKVFEMIDLGNWESATDYDQLHQAKAQRENLNMVEGRYSDVAVYDDHVLHIQSHNKFRLTAEYEALIRQMPELEQVFSYHVDHHLQLMGMMATQMSDTAAEAAPL